jgi:hypothetical protein
MHSCGQAESSATPHPENLVSVNETTLIGTATALCGVPEIFADFTVERLEHETHSQTGRCQVNGFEPCAHFAGLASHYSSY